ncbi:MAG TPA: lysylphosphatidylglycerol synthase transmembrane domain-containing protein [Solirubrobacteraceae bacterium]|nr:lysylphosphatidylglycerol synthase transmembrane domain-containing protein [Solirubrobacteraceae bacterium]
MSLDQPPEVDELNAAKARRSLRNGFITLILGLALAAGLLLAVPGLKGVATTLSNMKAQWVVAAILLEVLSCASYVVAFLQVFERAPFRFGARIALSEEAFGAAVSVGGVGSVAVGAWLMVERGAPARRIAERSAVLFLYTSAINVITLILAGLGLFLGMPGPDNPLLSILPAAVGALVLVLFLLLPRYVDRIVSRLEPGRLHALLTETAASVRDTKQLVFRPDWRIVGAIGYLWFDIAVLFACFAAAGHLPPLAPVVLAYQIGYLSNFIPIPGGIGVLDGSMIGMLVLYGVGGTVATAATLAYHAISLWVPAVWGTIAFIVLQKTKRQPIILRNPTEELGAGPG